MANNTFQVKRTTVTGRTPNTTNSANTQYLNLGELALNLTDYKMFTSNGTTYYEIGANLINQSVTNSFTFTSLFVINTTALMVNSSIYLGGSNGTPGQVLTSNGTSNVYWSTVTGGSNSVNTANQYIFSNTITFNSSLLANNILASSIVNATSHTTGDGTLTNVGGSVVNTSQITVGNSSVNAFINSTSVSVSNLNITTSAVINTNSLTVGNSTVNSTINATGFYVNSAPMGTIGRSWTTSIGFNLI